MGIAALHLLQAQLAARNLADEFHGGFCFSHGCDHWTLLARRERFVVMIGSGLQQLQKGLAALDQIREL